MTNNNFDLQTNLNLALQNIQKRNFTEAIKLYENILKIYPRNFDANLNLGTIFAQNKNVKKATEFWTKAIEINPNVPDAHNNLASAYISLNDNEKALEHINKAININPNFSLAYNNLGIVNGKLGKTDEAIISFLKAIEIQPKNVMAYYNLANSYQKINDISNSEKCYLKVIDINPKFFSAYNNLMNLYERIGENKKLNEIIKNAEKYFENDSSVKLFKGKLFFKSKQFEEAIKNLNTIKFDIENENKETTRCSTLAKCYDQIGNFDKAYEFFKKANETNYILNKDKINKEKTINIIKDRISFFENPKIKEWPKSKLINKTENPIFLVGFPRSGTTLLDTILRSHSSIEVIEEKPIMDEFIQSLNKKIYSNLNNLKTLDEKLLAEMRKIYFDIQSKYVGNDDKKIYIDKMPLNLIHAGEIVRIFPDAKFILAVRHPCDCVLSCFMQNFVLNDAMANFLDLKDSAEFYNYTMTLWNKYLNILSINFHEIKYEDVVNNFEISIKKLLEFLNLPWSENVTKFYETAENRGIISTPSYDQVNKPLYSKSIGRWKNYETQFSQIISILKPWIKKYEYKL